MLSNAFTLAPVPGAIAALGAKPVFLEITESLTVDPDHLMQAAKACRAKVLMLSHMRGHQPDMGALMKLCDALGLTVVEDCAHTMGGQAGGVVSGRHGRIACYSMQTYKHINSGEGGFLTTDDETLAARAVLLSGSYMLYERHGAAPRAEAFEEIRDFTPNISGRMDNLRAAILRPQLADLPAQVKNARTYSNVLRLMDRDPGLSRVGSSFQFRLPDHSEDALQAFVARCAARGVELKWFGARRAGGLTSTYRNWAYAETPDLPKTDRIVAGLLDMRLPLTFSVEDCRLIARSIASEVAHS